MSSTDTQQLWLRINAAAARLARELPDDLSPVVAELEGEIAGNAESPAVHALAVVEALELLVAYGVALPRPGTPIIVPSTAESA